VPNAMPNGASRGTIVVRAVCPTCYQPQPCRCYTAKRDGQARRAALDAADAQARAAQQTARATRPART